MNKYTVSVCPFCEGEGEVIIMKEKRTKKLYLYCNECETLWESPSDFFESKCLPQNTDVLIEEASFDEIKENNWDKYIKLNL